MKTEIDAISFIKKQLQEKLHKEEGFDVISELKWGATSRRIVFDLVVSKNGKLLAIFEIIKYSRNIETSKSWMLSYILSNTSANLLIFYCIDNEEYTIISRFPELEISNQSLDYVVDKIVEIGKTKNKGSIYFENIDTDKDRELRFYENTERLLNPEWCRAQLGNIQLEKICRYSSLDSLFNILKYKTLRMNGLPGMNDKGEGLFAWNLIYKEDKVNNDVYKQQKREINNAFIISFSSNLKIDDLTQWRMYGDDAKGVCCIFSVQKEKIKDRFFLHKVRYIKEPKDNEDISDELLQSFKKYVTQQSDLTYSDLSPAIFFYKSDSYKIEDEIRLLVDNKNTTAYKTREFKREWLLTNANNIPNPYIDIPLNSIPLKLEHILLGPNMNDVDTVQVQLETMLNQQGFNASVDISNIKSYRNQNN